jgi:hypothetical protein
MIHMGDDFSLQDESTVLIQHKDLKSMGLTYLIKKPNYTVVIKQHTQRDETEYESL